MHKISVAVAAHKVLLGVCTKQVPKAVRLTSSPALVIIAAAMADRRGEDERDSLCCLRLLKQTPLLLRRLLLRRELAELLVAPVFHHIIFGNATHNTCCNLGEMRMRETLITDIYCRSCVGLRGCNHLAVAAVNGSWWMVELILASCKEKR